jgi:hypothetical protein
VPNVVPILDDLETDTHLALLMPRAQISLREYQADGERIPEVETLPILIDIARALDGLTKVRTPDGPGIVHRDLKPENVLRLGGSWCLSDFGIARYAEKATDPHTLAPFMTRAYAAPEQWISERATAKTDVYAFGVMAFELLAGKRPFSDANLRNETINHDPPALVGVEPSLAAVVMMCLYKNPADRPAPEGLLRLLWYVPYLGRHTGFAALQRANLEAVTHRGVEIRKLFQIEGLRQEGGSQRGRTLAYESVRLGDWLTAPRASYNDIEVISARLQETIALHAPACEVIETQSGWSLKLGSATLSLRAPIRFQEATGHLPFRVAGYSEVTIAVSSGVGRAHSLWFCDARTGQFAWYETAFVRRGERRYSPSALRPDQIDAIAAIWLERGATDYEVATPFTPIFGDSLKGFVSRWVTWFATASRGGIIHTFTASPGVRGSWNLRGRVPDLAALRRQEENTSRQPRPPNWQSPIVFLEEWLSSLPWRIIIRLAILALIVAAAIVIPLQLRDSAVDRQARSAQLKCYVAFGTNPVDADVSNSPFPCNAIPRDRVGHESMWVFAELPGMPLGTASDHDISLRCSEPAHSLSGSSATMSNPYNDVRAEVSWNVDKPVDPLPVQLICQVLEGNKSVRAESFTLQTNPAG